MNKDLSIVYNGKLIEVRESIEQLKKLEFDTTKIERVVGEITSKVEKSIVENYSSFDRAESKTFLHDSLAITYNSAISRLNKIKDTIDKEYQEYLKINAKYQSLNNQMENVTLENIDSIANKGRKLLAAIRNSSMIDYKMEENLVNNIYELIYKIIKLELIYKGESLLINDTEIDETDYNYFSRLVNENIARLPEESQQEIEHIIIDLTAEGLTSKKYLDQKLLNTIIYSEEEILPKSTNAAFLQIMDEYEVLKEKYTNTETTSKELQSLEPNLIKSKKENRSKKRKKRIWLNINGILVAAALTTSSFVLRDMTKHKEYKTYTKTYNSETEKKKVTESYERKEEYDLEIKEYTPWIAPGPFRDEYERKVYTYDFSSIGPSYENLEECLTESIKDEMDRKDSETQTKEEQPKDYGYTENKYIIKEVKQDKAIYNIEDTYLAWLLAYLGTVTVIVLLDRLILKKTSLKEKYLKLKEDYIKSKSDLNENKTKLLECKKELNDLSLKLIHAREKAIKSYERLPEPAKNMPKIKQKLLELENNSNS